MQLAIFGRDPKSAAKSAFYNDKNFSFGFGKEQV